MDKYLPSLQERMRVIASQIEECKKIIYRNDVENLSFQANNEKAKIKEVEYNNQTLREKIDVLNEELERLNDEGKTGSSPTV